MTSDVHPPLLEQMILSEFMTRGHSQRHVRRMQAEYAEWLHAASGGESDRLPVESLDPINDESIRSLWVAEAIRRRDEVRSGAVQAIPAAVVMEEARKLTRK